MTTHTPEGLREAVARLVWSEFVPDRERTSHRSAMNFDVADDFHHDGPNLTYHDIRRFSFDAADAILAALPPNSRKKEGVDPIQGDLSDLVEHLQKGRQVGLCVPRGRSGIALLNDDQRRALLQLLSAPSPAEPTPQLFRRPDEDPEQYGKLLDQARAENDALLPAEPAKGSGELETIIRDLYAEYQADESGDSALLYELIERAYEALSRRTGSEVPQGWRDLNRDDLSRLSRAFCSASDLRTGQDIRINDALKTMIAAAPPPEGRG